MEIVEETVTPGFQRPDSQRYGSTTGYDLLDAQHVAFEFSRSRIEIFNGDRYRLCGWRMRLGWLKAMVLERNL